MMNRFKHLIGLALFPPLSAGAIDFDKDILPILEANCLDCHDGETLKGGVGLDSYYYATLPTDAGESLFVPGKPAESVLLHVVEESDPEKRMPPKGDPLTSGEIAALREWIDAGAVWPDDGWRPPLHWSFLAPTLPSLPEPDPMLADRHSNGIDYFIAAKLSANDLTINEETDPARLLRRVYLDTLGLPPTVEQVDEFLKNPTFAHYTQIVEELLSSPSFGEKWATQWLDLARYADSEGYQRDAPRNMWPYRDWVIDALNADMPFDQFSIEQLAGDLLPEATESQRIATAFHRNAPTNLEAGTDPEEDHYKVVADRTATTGMIWMGLTVGCAQCHNHKYDPISAKEYYELFAFFNNTPMETKQKGSGFGMSALQHIGPTLAVAQTRDDRSFEEVAATHYREARERADFNLRERAAEMIGSSETIREALDPSTVKLMATKTALSNQQMKTLQRALLPRDTEMAVEIEKVEISANRLKAMREKTVRVMEELGETRTTYIAKRGDFQARGEAVTPGTPAALHPFPENYPKNRLGLARWLVDPANPLVARTFVNRLWIEIFGRGLVTTPEDFGSQGELPTHPELLDWLSVTFVEKDAWSLKKSLRRILLSATYRQSVSSNETRAQKDPKNQLLWRHPGHRLSAETIRDQALAISGLLSPRMHGPHSRPYQPEGVWRKTAGASESYYIPSRGEDAYRRGVYTIWRRNNHYPSFANFDAPDRAACVIQRDVSNTPLQSLTLLNDPAFVEMAEAFAERIAREGGRTLDAQVDWAFRTALSRSPKDSERLLLQSAHESVLGESGSKQKALFELATILMNLHESISRS
ncbi:MAG: PSD1 and planctomycete cytochrome C domain-containing protein [Verrucomicrobiales bacterium]|nr:PSD1 and planctomycete cytochrome C domain-containing protein [Verrucomicrobiales bacterium]